MNAESTDLTSAIRAACLAFEQAIRLNVDDQTAFRLAMEQYRLFREGAPEQEVREMMSLAMSWEMQQRLDASR